MKAAYKLPLASVAVSPRRTGRALRVDAAVAQPAAAGHPALQQSARPDENKRLARMCRECDISPAPVWLLAAACAALGLVLSF